VNRNGVDDKDKMAIKRGFEASRKTERLSGHYLSMPYLIPLLLLLGLGLWGALLQ
jgi:hypothetical protein